MHSLLVPIDFSEHAKSALRVASELAAAAKLQVVAVHAYQISAQNHFMNLDAIRQLESAAANEARERLSAFLKAHTLPGVNVHSVVRLGFATEEVIAVSEQMQVDLVVMGTRGAADLKSRFLGTNTATVMDNISSPVLAVTLETQFQGIRRILYPTHADATNLFALARLVDIAAAFDAAVRVLHFPGRDHVTKAEQRMPELLRQALRYSKIEFEVAQGEGVLAEIYRSAAETKADLLAVNTTERPVFSKVLAASTSRDHAERMRLPMLALN